MTITEVSNMYNISADTLRYYERIGLLPNIKRNKRGVRDYDETDLKWVEFIKCMRDSGMSIEILIDYVRLCKSEEDTIESRKDILIEQRDVLLNKMAELQKTIDKLNYKIEVYESKLIDAEKKLK